MVSFTGQYYEDNSSRHYRASYFYNPSEREATPFYPRTHGTSSPPSSSSILALRDNFDHTKNRANARMEKDHRIREEEEEEEEEGVQRSRQHQYDNGRESFTNRKYYESGVCRERSPPTREHYSSEENRITTTSIDSQGRVSKPLDCSPSSSFLPSFYGGNIKSNGSILMSGGDDLNLYSSDDSLDMEGFDADQKMNRYEQKLRRSRTTFSTSQLEILEQEFERFHYPDVARREALAVQIKMSESKVQVG